MNDIKRFLNKPLACYGAVIMGVIGIINLLCLIGFVGGIFGAAGSGSLSGLASSLSDALSMVGLVKILSWLALIAGIYVVVCCLYAMIAGKETGKFWIILLVTNLYGLYANFRGTQLFGLLDDFLSGASESSGYYSSLLDMSSGEMETMILMILFGLILMYVVGLVVGSYMYFRKVPLPRFMSNIGKGSGQGGAAPQYGDAPVFSDASSNTPPQQGASFCPHCGSPITPGQKFCVKCGHALESNQEGSGTNE